VVGIVEIIFVFSNSEPPFMQGNILKDISKFRIAGINYKKTDAALRGQFAIQHEQYRDILIEASSCGLTDLFILSTCNRTEIYGFADSISQLINLLCKQTTGSKEVFTELSYTKNGHDAIEHLFNVSAGLDSQILGDYEIVGQIKTSVKFSKEHGCINAFMERLVNTVLQSSKAIKNQTELSSGTVSVSFAAVQYIREHVKDIADKKILLLGIGKIGKNTCRNLVDYLETKNITLINRTEDKASELAREMDLNYASINELPGYIAQSDIILVATASSEPTILYSHLEGDGKKLIIDLSIPYNVEETAQHLPNITLINVDELSKLKDATLAMREAEVPKAQAIIEEHIAEFTEWYEMRKHVPVLKAVKTKLKEIHTSPLFIPLYNSTHTEEKIQRVINGMAFRMKGQTQHGCHYIQAINEFIATGTN
jgi:glutamyl-tRNA reductase